MQWPGAAGPAHINGASSAMPLYFQGPGLQTDWTPTSGAGGQRGPRRCRGSTLTAVWENWAPSPTPAESPAPHAPTPDLAPCPGCLARPVERVHDVRVVRSSQVSADAAALGGRAGELGHRLFRVLAAVPANRIGQRRLYPCAAQDHAGGHHARGVRRVLGPLSRRRPSRSTTWSASASSRWVRSLCSRDRFDRVQAAGIRLQRCQRQGGRANIAVASHPWPCEARNPLSGICKRHVQSLAGIVGSLPFAYLLAVAGYGGHMLEPRRGGRHAAEPGKAGGAT